MFVDVYHHTAALRCVQVTCRSKTRATFANLGGTFVEWIINKVLFFSLHGFKFHFIRETNSRFTFALVVVQNCSSTKPDHSS